MKDIARPVLAQAMRLVSLGKPELASHEAYREWVIANHQSGYDLVPLAPGRTGWQYQVPFWTKNAEPCRNQFAGYTHVIENTDDFDRATGLTLMHGYWCTGGNGNNANSTYVMEDFEPGKLRDGVTDESIRDATIAIKFYCYGKMQPQVKTPYWRDPRLVIVCAALRVERGEIVCLPININSNLYFIGGHGSETRADISHRIYTRGAGWQHNLRNSNWGAFRSSGNATEIERERKRHARVLELLLPAFGK